MYEPKVHVGLKMPTATIKAIKKGRRQVNLSHEIRRLVALGLESEATFEIQETTESGAEAV